MNPLYILYAIFIFGLLIFIHELGHFIVARLCGVKVLEFAIGMGPKLISWKSKKSGIRYSLRAFPIGGFVNMLGENGMEAVQGDNGMELKAEKNNKKEDETIPLDQLPPELAKQAYCNQNVWKRILISVAGPAMNIILGFLLMLVIVLVQGPNAAGGTIVAGFHVQYTAEEAQYGFEPNDYLDTYTIVNEAGEEKKMPIRSYGDFKRIIQESDGEEIKLTVQRLNAERTQYEDVDLTVVLNEADLKLFTGSLSENCGLEIHDKVIKVNSTRVHTYDELSYEIMNQGYKPMKFTVIRDGEKIVLEDVIIPSTASQGVVLGTMDFQIYREGATLTFATVVKHTWFRSLSTVKMVYDSLFGLFSGRYGVEAVSGPVGITKVVGEAAKYGFVPLMNLVIVISINLGVMNLLPIPALDGGHIFIYLIEVVRRKPMKRELEGIINLVGLAVMLALAVLVAIKDIITL